MMRIGPDGGKNRDNYYIQTNNPTEQLLKKYRGAEWLVSCGATSMINCIAPLGANVDIKVGNYTLQPEELVTDFLNDPRNYPKLRSIRDLNLEKYAGQEVPQYYPFAASVLFGMTAKFAFGLDWDDVHDHLYDGNTVQVCLVNPGHYISIVGLEEGELIYNDSWPGRHDDGNGFNRVLTASEFNTNLKDYAIWYYG
jgi:hypothetical protein